MSQPIHFRISDIDPPTPEPKKTIYRDRYNLPTPTHLGLSARIYNDSGVSLYMQMTGSGPGYTFATVNIGLMATGNMIWREFDDFAQRARPAGELEETITLILRGYQDSGYTILLYTFEREVKVVWIDSSLPDYTIDMLNNFDDGTVQGWAGRLILGTSITLSVSTAYFLSAPYSLLASLVGPASGEHRSEIYKNVTTPNRSKVYTIMDIHNRGAGACKELLLMRDDDWLLHIGRTWDTTTSVYIPYQRWFRIVSPLPINVSFELRLREIRRFWTGGTGTRYHDDIKIISK